MRIVHGWLGIALLAGMTGCSRGAGHPAARTVGAETPADDTASTPIVRATAAEFGTIVRRPGAAATLVNVWATWCEPCREEMPALVRVAKQRQGDGLRLVLVSADFADQLPAVRRFLLTNGVAETTYIKTGDDMAFIDTLNTKWSGALPATFVYDRFGRAVTYWEGRADSARFNAAVDQAVRSSAIHEGLRP